MNTLLNIWYYSIAVYYVCFLLFFVWNYIKQKDSGLASEFIFFICTDTWFGTLFTFVGLVPVLNVLATLIMFRGLYTIHKEAEFERRFRQSDN